MQVCLKPPSTYNTLAALHSEPVPIWFEAIVRYGCSPMHFKKGAMEALCIAARSRKIALEQRRRKRRYPREYFKSRLQEIKEADQEGFIQEVNGLRIDFPDKKVPCHLT